MVTTTQRASRGRVSPADQPDHQDQRRHPQGHRREHPAPDHHEVRPERVGLGEPVQHVGDRRSARCSGAQSPTTKTASSANGTSTTGASTPATPSRNSSERSSTAITDHYPARPATCATSRNPGRAAGRTDGAGGPRAAVSPQLAEDPARSWRSPRPAAKKRSASASRAARMASAAASPAGGERDQRRPPVGRVGPALDQAARLRSSTTSVVERGAMRRCSASSLSRIGPCRASTPSARDWPG